MGVQFLRVNFLAKLRFCLVLANQILMLVLFACQLRVVIVFESGSGGWVPNLQFSSLPLQCSVIRVTILGENDAFRFVITEPKAGNLWSWWRFSHSNELYLY